jgi:DNA-binding transcriptional LysR family regulator
MGDGVRAVETSRLCTMDLRQLEIFLETARWMNFTRAAKVLHIAQPAVSQAVARLEGELGVTLFDRTGREVRLTEAGARLVPHAERILSDVDLAEREIARLRGRALGRISVGVTPTVATHLLPRALAAYRAERPEIEVVLREGGTGALMTMIERGAVDFGIVVLPTDRPTIQAVPLFTEPLLLAVADTSPVALAALRRDGAHSGREDWAGPAPIPLRMAANEAFILYRASYHLRSATIEGCRAAGFEPRVALEGGEMETVLRMVAAGLGVSLVPQLAFEGAPRSGVIALPVSDPPLSRTLGVAHRHDRPLSPAAEAFVATLRDAVGQEA